MRALVLALLVAIPSSAEVRPISDAEHAAVEIAAGYLSRGPAAVAERIASTSPLRGATDLHAEIEVRLGPRKGARWELQTVVPALKDRLAVFSVVYPSGFDDAVIFEMTKDGRLSDIRFLAQSTAGFQPAVSRAASPRRQDAGATAGWKPAVLGALLSFAAIFLARRRVLFVGMLSAAAALLVSASAISVLQQQATHASVITRKRAQGPPPLATLLPLRRALAGDGSDIEAAFRAVDRTPACAMIADLWKVQAALQQTDRTAVKAALAALPSSDIPLAEILRGRLALLEHDEAGAAVAFERAVNLGPGRDGIWYEAAAALLALGYEERAAEYLLRLVRIGSREADVYYSLASLAASNDRDEEAELLLRQAWSMRPVEREQLLRMDVFWSLLRRQMVAETISLSAPQDPLVTSPVASTRAIPLPVEAQPRMSGEFLHIAIGEQQLLVPGGAALAIPGTPVVAATEWARAEAERRLADLPNVMSFGRNASAYAQPALRERITGTAEALADRNRWAELVQLTEHLSAAAEYVPPSIFFLRSIGLQRLQRPHDARRLLVDVAASRVLQRKRDAAALSELAELFAAHDLYDAAVRMYDRSQSIRANPFIDDRVRQIQMNKRLATKYYTHQTAHFEIHYPDDVSNAAATELGTVLEAELARLQEWIPTRNFQRVVVNVVWWREFRATYTGSDYVLGFYNGKITVPIAGTALVPQIVAILGHELAHAMMAQATNDQAPRWFQEGLAQRIELAVHHRNAFNMYDDDRLLPVSLLDAVLHASPDPEMVAAAYIVAQTDIRYIESKYGKGALHTMLDAFRDGATTEEALRRVTGKPIAAFETELRAWGRTERRVFQ
ncbi:MAG TPA: hypothetical protein VNA69_09460 [Thermoanaerobaculia bacterium]|nr:hypothetical protein [Thermoanaerobaculia bacterium]